MVDKKVLLEKFEGKGGWTFARVPEFIQNPNNPFGWVTVSGSIDNYQLIKIKLMPMGDKQLFVPVKAVIRKKIKKEAGDTVHLILHPDESPTVIPQELIECLQLASPHLLKVFQELSENKKQYFLKWIYDVKTEDLKAKRINQMIDELLAITDNHQ